MDLDGVFARCREIVEDLSFETVRAWKEGHPGRKVIGCFPVYTPKEVIHAAGMLPVGVMGAGLEMDVDRAESRLQSFVCSIARSTLELGLCGRLAHFDGMIFTSICDVARNLSGVWERNFPQKLTEYVHFPQNMTSRWAASYYRGELDRLRRRLEGLGGVCVTDDSLRASLSAFNLNRELIRRLYALRAESPWGLSLLEAYLVVRAGAFLPVEEHSQMLRQVLEVLPRREARPRDYVRVILQGSFCEQPPLELIESIEQAGCYVVDDDLQLGSWWFLEDVPAQGDPLGALAESYLNRSVTSSVRHDGRRSKGRDLVERVQRLKADGVLFCTAKFCEPALLDYVLQKDALDAAGIPYLAFEFEEKMGVFDSIRMQVETFAESILFFS